MCFSMRPRALPQGMPSRLATRAMVVSMQARSPEATRSVGEKAAPSPPLSFGPSVGSVAPLGPW